MANISLGNLERSLSVNRLHLYISEIEKLVNEHYKSRDVVVVSCPTPSIKVPLRSRLNITDKLINTRYVPDSNPVSFLSIGLTEHILTDTYGAFKQGATCSLIVKQELVCMLSYFLGGITLHRTTRFVKTNGPSTMWIVAEPFQVHQTSQLHVAIRYTSALVPSKNLGERLDKYCKVCKFRLKCLLKKVSNNELGECPYIYSQIH